MFSAYFLPIKIFHPGIVIGATGFSIFNPAFFCQASISGTDHVPDELVNEKVIQTKGVYYSGIEESSLYNFELTSDNLPEKYRTISLPALWVEFDIDWNQSKSKILKSLPKNNTIVTIQGIIDTTSKGHLGQYAAAIKDAKLISLE